MTTEQGEPGHAPTREETQAALIVEAFAEQGITIGVAGPGTPGGIDFLYQQGAVLVRERDAARVRAVVGGDDEGDEPVIGGLVLLSLAGAREGLRETLPALDAIDTALGVGVATPNHVVSIAPVAHCPATEPESVRRRADPDPGVCPDPRAGAGVFVGVVDTGLLRGAAKSHAWLAGVKGVRDPFPQPPPRQATMPAYTGHGTFIAGVARCMAPAARVFVDAAFPQAGAELEAVFARRLGHVLARGADVISLSAGTHTRLHLPLLGFEWLVERRLRHHKGVVLVAAAGNSATRRPFWPAAFPGVVSVGALSANWRSRAPFSNHGGWVDVYAPGQYLVNAFATGV